MLSSFFEKGLSTIGKRIVPLVIGGYLLFLLVLLAGVAHHTYFSRKIDEQPIAFVHSIHVAELGLECDYCHIYASKSVSAGIPAMQIQKLARYWEDGEPIPWVRVHSLPDHVYFSHKRHIKAGVDCSVCHGQIATMSVARKVRSLQMGWCVSCHRSKGAPTDCLICHK
jgi:hypothetical protein